ncbi:MAG: threonine synthase, partial [Chloroflexi bacterium]|nr:threonine synthase [Chloroflexota bacterium]
CGLPTLVLVPRGNVAGGKLAQAIAYGAHIFSMDGNFDRALELARQLSQRQEIALVNSVNPYRIDGQKTASFEIADELGDAPDYVCIPVGNAGNITAYWKGFREYYQARRTTRLPKMWGYQAEGAAPIVRGEPIADPQTVASAIRIGNPASWEGAVAARDESGGMIDAVTDAEILDAYKRMARMEGIFCEPASAASLAGLTKQVRLGADLMDKTVVCIITGNGLKDPQLADEIADIPVRELPPDLDAVEEAAIASLKMG